MGRLDCKEPSFIALNGLARDADFFLTLDDEEVTSYLEKCLVLIWQLLLREVQGLQRL